ncbi:MAG: hypothetical protein CL862_13215 [Cyanobium sp. NAT70]|nr:hypothetical protein [Cyanobium sp. NAT70]
MFDWKIDQEPHEPTCISLEETHIAFRLQFAMDIRLNHMFTQLPGEKITILFISTFPGNLFDRQPNWKPRVPSFK